MSSATRQLPPTAWWEHVVRQYEARQAVAPGWLELPSYIRLLRQVAESPYAALVRPWLFCDLLVIARDGDGPPSAAGDSVQVFPDRRVRIVLLRGGTASTRPPAQPRVGVPIEQKQGEAVVQQVPVESVECAYEDAWPQLQAQLGKLLGRAAPNRPLQPSGAARFLAWVRSWFGGPGG
jgi:hypothetical protein